MKPSKLSIWLVVPVLGVALWGCPDGGGTPGSDVSSAVDVLLDTGPEAGAEVSVDDGPSAPDLPPGDDGAAVVDLPPGDDGGGEDLGADADASEPPECLVDGDCAHLGDGICLAGSCDATGTCQNVPLPIQVDNKISCRI